MAFNYQALNGYYSGGYNSNVSSYTHSYAGPRQVIPVYSNGFYSSAGPPHAYSSAGPSQSYSSARSFQAYSSVKTAEKPFEPWNDYIARKDKEKEAERREYNRLRNSKAGMSTEAWERKKFRATKDGMSTEAWERKKRAQRVRFANMTAQEKQRQQQLQQLRRMRIKLFEQAARNALNKYSVAPNVTTSAYSIVPDEDEEKPPPLEPRSNYISDSDSGDDEDEDTVTEDAENAKAQAEKALAKEREAHVEFLNACHQAMLDEDPGMSPDEMDRHIDHFDDAASGKLKDCENPYVKAFEIWVKGMNRSKIVDTPAFWKEVWEATNKQVQDLKANRKTPEAAQNAKIQKQLSGTRTAVSKAVKKSLNNIHCLRDQGWINEQETKLEKIKTFCQLLWMDKDIGHPPRINWTDKCRDPMQIMLSCIGTNGST
ncbi:MAG: hypothetical protein SGILL_004663 [Bacillariaceae sp.]